MHGDPGIMPVLCWIPVDPGCFLGAGIVIPAHFGVWIVIPDGCRASATSGVPSRTHSLTQPLVVLARWLDVHASATCTRLVGGATWHPPACGALQDCGRSKAEVARPARVEKDPQGRLYLAAEVCQLRTPIRTGDSGGAARPACSVILPTPELRHSVGRALPLCVWATSVVERYRSRSVYTTLGGSRCGAFPLGFLNS